MLSSLSRFALEQGTKLIVSSDDAAQLADTAKRYIWDTSKRDDTVVQALGQATRRAYSAGDSQAIVDAARRDIWDTYKRDQVIRGALGGY